MIRLRHQAYDDGVNAWTMTQAAASPELAGLIDGYCDYSERTAGFSTRRELPHPEGVLIFNLGEAIRIKGGDGREIGLGAGEAFVAGAHLRPAFSQSGGAQAGVHVYLPLSTIRRMLGTPMDRLLDQTVPFEDRCLGERLLDARGIEERVGVLDAALRRRFSRTAALDARQIGAIHLLRQRPDLEIGEVARQVGWSRKHLAERVRDAVGVGPRTFRRLLRFQRAVKNSGQDWARTALDAGYCDQSHLIRDFREFAGMTPTEYSSRLLGDGGGLVES